MHVRRVAVPLHGATPNFAIPPRRVVGPALQRARALRLRETGALAVIGHAVRWSDFEALRARPTRAVPFKGRMAARSVEGKDVPRSWLLPRLTRRAP